MDVDSDSSVDAGGERDGLMLTRGEQLPESSGNNEEGLSDCDQQAALIGGPICQEPRPSAVRSVDRDGDVDHLCKVPWQIEVHCIASCVGRSVVGVSGTSLVAMMLALVGGLWAIGSLHGLWHRQASLVDRTEFIDAQATPAAFLLSEVLPGPHDTPEAPAELTSSTATSIAEVLVPLTTRSNAVVSSELQDRAPLATASAHGHDTLGKNANATTTSKVAGHAALDIKPNATPTPRVQGRVHLASKPYAMAVSGVPSHAALTSGPSARTTTSSPIRRARCGACDLAPPNAPRLFMRERRDGAGSTLHSIIYGMAVAAANSMNFGGVMLERRIQTEHGVNIRDFVTKALGFESKWDLFSVQRMGLSYRYHSLEMLERARRHPDNSSVYLLCATVVKSEGIAGMVVKHRRTLDDYLTPRFLAALRGDTGQPWSKSVTPCGNTRGAKGWIRPHVAVHVRRGDKKGEPDRVFLEVIQRIQAVLPQADVHVFSQKSNFIGTEGYEALGAHIHLDDEDLFKIWTRFVCAKVFVVSKSSFSWVPAFFTTGCVIYIPYKDGREAPSAWATHRDMEGIRRCVARARRNDGIGE